MFTSIIRSHSSTLSAAIGAMDMIPGIVHNDVNTAVPINCAFDKSLDISALCHIGLIPLFFFL